MRKMTTNNGTWRIHGINLIPSDDIYINLQQAINDDNLDQAYLQKISGNYAPIIVDKVAKTIDFSRF